MNKFDEEILKVNKVICSNIAKQEALGVGLLSQNIISQLRNFVEAIAIKIYSETNETSFEQEERTKALKFIRREYKFDFLRRFHKCLQVSASHSTADIDASVRLMWKYLDYLYTCKEFLKKEYLLDVLGNLDEIELGQDETLKQYYKAIYDIVSNIEIVKMPTELTDRYYIHKKKPIFVKGKKYYELTLALADDNVSKSDRIIAFTSLDIPDYYSVRLQVKEANIQVINKIMNITIITGYMVSVRPCEFDNYFKLIGFTTNIQTANVEYKNLMRYLTQTGMNLTELLDCEQEFFDYVENFAIKDARSKNIFEGLKKCRSYYGKSGFNILKFLLYRLNNQIVKDQYNTNINEELSNLHLKYGCIPFEKMPFAFNLIKHPSLLSDLFDCFDSVGREYELLARRIKTNTEQNAKLYTPISELERFKDIENLIKTFNSKLYKKHIPDSCLQLEDGHVYIKGYENNTIEIVKKLIDFAGGGINNYKESVEDWLSKKSYIIDSPEKSEVLKNLFTTSRVALIYGSAGTGKSTMINHISTFFNGFTMLYLANTHAAVENLRRIIGGNQDNYKTVKSCSKSKNIYTDILFIDECSTISNQDMVDILKNIKFKLLILVGDIYQIESIKFGNWFSIARYYIPKNAIFELSYVHRSTDGILKKLWQDVRNLDENIYERLESNNFSSAMSETIFDKQHSDEIILCLNYDGLYGINNVNRFLQDNNNGKTVKIGIEKFKVGDPIIFKESKRFDGLLYNNLKGKILDISETDTAVIFTTEVDKVLNQFDTENYSVELLPSNTKGKSVIRFSVGKQNNIDDENRDIKNVIPFRVAYAISIHKAQGLEFDSVKIVISDEINELISHNIFYTAITRAKKHLKIYWSNVTEKNILNNMHLMYNSNDAKILAKKFNLKLTDKNS